MVLQTCSSYNSPPCVATQELNSGDRKVVKATVEQVCKTMRRYHEEGNKLADDRAMSLKADIQSGDNKHAAEREKAEEHRAAAEVERAAAKEHRAVESAARLERIRRQEAELEAKEKAQIAEMRAKVAEQATARIAEA